MSTAVSYPHIVVDAAGVAQIDQTRYKVAHLAAEHYGHGWTAEELLRQHPDLRPEQVYAALVYFYDHYEQIVQSLQQSADAVEASRREQESSRAGALKHAWGRTTTPEERRAAIAAMRKIAAEHTLGGLKIKDLINEGRP